jgi:hypothetical protein
MSLSAYFAMVWVGIRVLMEPMSNLNFIYNTSFIWWIMELLSIAAITVLFGKTENGENWRDSPLLYFGYFGFFFLGIFLISNDKLLTGLFGISLAGKFFLAKTIKTNKQKAINEMKKLTAISGMVMILCTFLALVTSDIVLQLSPYSVQIISTMPENVEMAKPLLFVIWGVLYGTMMVAAQVVLIVKKNK